MPIRIRPVADIAKKWAQRAGGAGPDYSEGVRNPGRPQNEAAIEAAPTWAAGVQAAISRNAFVTGLERAGENRWRDRASTVGAQRFTQGVGTPAAAADYARGAGPILAAIAALDLPPRLPRGDPNNNQRVNMVTAAARAASLANR